MKRFIGGFTISNNLSSKQKLFCHYFTQLQNPKEAAIKAGFTYESAEKTAFKLLQSSSVQKYIDRILSSDKSKLIHSSVINGLFRLAFGLINDPIKLILASNHTNDPFIKSVDALDLFNISEIKRSKDGNFEIKFFDRFKALDKLMSLSENKNTCSELIKAIEKSSCSDNFDSDSSNFIH